MLNYIECRKNFLVSIGLLTSYDIVHGQVVKVVDFEPLAPHHCGFEFRQGLCILSCEEAIQLAYGTSVVLK
jgi:hypothetical protein